MRESVTFFMLAYPLLLAVFAGFPWFVAYRAKENEKLKTFVLAIFGPFFACVLLFMLVNAFTVVTMGHNPFEQSFAWIFVYLALQATFFMGFKNFRLLK